MTDAPPVEVELKYRVADTAAGERLLHAESLGSLRALGSARTTKTEDQYIDTADGAVAAAGYAARLRRDGDATLVTVKELAKPNGSVARRVEFEGPTDGSREPTAWPPSSARTFLLEITGSDPLVDVATIRQRRRKRKFGVDDTVAELSLDDVEVLADGKPVDTFTELEIELTDGPDTPLLEAARELDADPSLSPSPTSKLDAAKAAVQRRRDTVTPSAVTAALAALAPGKAAGVTADDVLSEAGRKVLRFHLARMVAREAGTRLGEDPEELHAMRVATRRMRAAWRVFGDGFRADQTSRFRARLRDVARRLGAVRDLDVLIEALEAYAGTVSGDERKGLEPLLADWRAQREAGRVVLMRELDSGRYRRFVDAYVTFALTPGSASLVVSPTEPHHVRDTAGSRIWHAYEAVLAYGPVLRWADVPTLHQMRIAGKWLRYTLEFVAEPLGAEAKPLIAKVVALQDHLGLMNDAEVASMKARALLVARAGTLSDLETHAIARYLASREREVVRLKRGAPTVWRGLASPVYRRALGRAIANLATTRITTTPT
jgi:CHAD domain-containing protein